MSLTATKNYFKLPLILVHSLCGTGAKVLCLEFAFYVINFNSTHLFSAKNGVSFKKFYAWLYEARDQIGLSVHRKNCLFNFTLLLWVSNLNLHLKILLV